MLKTFFILTVVFTVGFDAFSQNKREKYMPPDSTGNARDTISQASGRDLIECVCIGAEEKALNSSSIFQLRNDGLSLRAVAEEAIEVNVSGAIVSNTGLNTELFDCENTDHTMNEKLFFQDKERTLPPMRGFTINTDPELLKRRPGGYTPLDAQGARIVLREIAIFKDYESHTSDEASKRLIGGKYDVFGVHVVPESSIESLMGMGETFEEIYEPCFLWVTKDEKNTKERRMAFKEKMFSLIGRYPGAGVLAPYLNDKRGLDIHGIKDQLGGNVPFECEFISPDKAGPQVISYNPGYAIAAWTDDFKNLPDEAYVLFHVGAGDGKGVKRDDAVAIFRVRAGDLRTGKPVLYRHRNSVGGIDLAMVVQLVLN